MDESGEHTLHLDSHQHTLTHTASPSHIPLTMLAASIFKVAMAAGMSSLMQAYLPLQAHQSCFFSVAAALFIPSTAYASVPDCQQVADWPSTQEFKMKTDCSDVRDRGSYDEQVDCLFSNGFGRSSAYSYWYPRQNSHSLNIFFTAVDKAVFFSYTTTDQGYSVVYKVPRGTTCNVFVQPAWLALNGMITWTQ